MIEIKLVNIKDDSSGSSEDRRKKLLQALRLGMLYAERISKENYLSGPRSSVIGDLGGKIGVGRGWLRQSVRGEVEPGLPGSGILGIGILGSSLWYAKVQERGYGIYGGMTSSIAYSPSRFITPKSKRTLKFISSKTGELVYSKFTRGIPARPFLRPAIIDALPTIRKLLEGAMK